MASVKSVEYKKELVAPVPKKSAAHDKASHSNSIGADGLIVSFMMILDAVTISNHSALRTAKEMSGLADKERKENGDLAGIDEAQIPTAQNVKENTPGHETWVDVSSYNYGIHWKILRNTHWVQKYVPGKTVSYVQNQAEIENVQLYNQTRTGARNEVQNRLMVLQQEQQVNVTGENTISDETAQSIQKGAKILDTLSDLGYKALQRRAPSDED